MAFTNDVGPRLVDLSCRFVSFFPLSSLCATDGLDVQLSDDLIRLAGLPDKFKNRLWVHTYTFALKKLTEISRLRAQRTVIRKDGSSWVPGTDS